MNNSVIILVQPHFNITLSLPYPANPNPTPVPLNDLLSFLSVKAGRDPLNLNSLIRQARGVLKRLRASKRHQTPKLLKRG